MWLLDTHTGRLVPSKGPYAILSHVWAESGEQTFQEVKGLPPSTSGFAGLSAKISGCCAFAADLGYSQVWIDSCCIDKASSAELSEAINSMYLWYSRAFVCFVYLDDVEAGEDLRSVSSQFRRSRWWTRGWTLQELIAPNRVLFLSRDWEPLGTKTGLADLIEEITRVDRAVLVGERALDTISVAKRMSWAADRRTTRLEDEAYSLMGLFDIHMPTLYGEGRRAFIRLQEEIIRRIPDQSIFAWGIVRLDIADLGRSKSPFTERSGSTRLLFADTPQRFKTSNSLTSVPAESVAGELGQTRLPMPEFAITSYGVRSRLLLIPFKYGASLVTYVAVLSCRDSAGDILVLLLQPQDGDRSSVRFVVGDWCPFQRVRLASLSTLRSAGALAGDAEMKEVYIAYQSSSPPPLVAHDNRPPRGGSGDPARCVSFPFWLLFPVRQIAALAASGFVLRDDPVQGHRNRALMLEVGRGTYHRSITMDHLHDGSSITIKLSRSVDLSLTNRLQHQGWLSWPVQLAVVVKHLYRTGPMERVQLVRGSATVNSWDHPPPMVFQLRRYLVRLAFTPYEFGVDVQLVELAFSITTPGAEGLPAGGGDT